LFGNVFQIAQFVVSQPKMEAQVCVVRG